MYALLTRISPSGLVQLIIWKSIADSREAAESMNKLKYLKKTENAQIDRNADKEQKRPLLLIVGRMNHRPGIQRLWIQENLMN